MSLAAEKINSVDIEFGLINTIFKNYEKDIKIDIEFSKYPRSNKAIFYGIKKMDFLLDNLLSCNNFYVSNILTRSLLEHYIVSYYIGVKSQLDCSDEIGRQYYEEYKLADHLKRLNYDLMVKHLEQNKPAPQFADLQASYEDYARLTLQEKDRIMGVWNHFYRIQNLIKYLLHNEKQENTAKLYHEQLPILLNIYNVTSSYVHGGAVAEFETNELSLSMQTRRIESFVMYGKMVVYSLKLRLISSLIKTNKMYNRIVLPVEYFILKQFYRFNYRDPEP